MNSVTTDNGTEFSGFLDIIELTGTKFYFCHPYASCEKGTNEKTMKIKKYLILMLLCRENFLNNGR